MSVLIEPLSRLYEFRESGAVAAFLDEHPFLLELLTEARERIREHFGQDSTVSLEVLADPEAQENRELVAYVQTRLAPNDAWECLRCLDQSWWLGACSRARGLLTIHVEYI